MNSPITSSWNQVGVTSEFGKTCTLKRSCGFETQRYCASGLNLVTAAIILWNIVYLERSINALKNQGQLIDETLLQ